MAVGLQKELDFALSSKRRRCQTFERRLKPRIDTLQTVLALIMTYRTPLAEMAFCADRRPLRNAR